MKVQILRNVAILGLFSVLAIASVHAQTPSRVEANIPFDFSAGKATMKTGTYSIRKTNGNGLTIRNLQDNSTTVVNAPLTVGSRSSKAGARLVFNRYGDQYFLSQVWTTADSGKQLFPSNAEKTTARQHQLANNGAKAERIEVALR